MTSNQKVILGKNGRKFIKCEKGSVPICIHRELQRLQQSPVNQQSA